MPGPILDKNWPHAALIYYFGPLFFVPAPLHAELESSLSSARGELDDARRLGSAAIEELEVMHLSKYAKSALHLDPLEVIPQNKPAPLLRS